MTFEDVFGNETIEDLEFDTIFGGADDGELIDSIGQDYFFTESGEEKVTGVPDDEEDEKDRDGDREQQKKDEIAKEFADIMVEERAQFNFFPQFHQDKDLRRFSNIIKDCEVVLNSEAEDPNIGAQKCGMCITKILDVIIQIVSIPSLVKCITVIGIPYYLFIRLLSYCNQLAHYAFAESMGKKIISTLERTKNESTDKEVQAECDKQIRKVREAMYNMRESAELDYNEFDDIDALQELDDVDYFDHADDLEEKCYNGEHCGEHDIHAHIDANGHEYTHTHHYHEPHYHDGDKEYYDHDPFDNVEGEWGVDDFDVDDLDHDENKHDHHGCLHHHHGEEPHYYDNCHHHHDNNDDYKYYDDGEIDDLGLDNDYHDEYHDADSEYNDIDHWNDNEPESHPDWREDELNVVNAACRARRSCRESEIDTPETTADLDRIISDDAFPQDLRDVHDNEEDNYDEVKSEFFAAESSDSYDIFNNDYNTLNDEDESPDSEGSMDDWDDIDSIM